MVMKDYYSVTSLKGTISIIKLVFFVLINKINLAIAGSICIIVIVHTQSYLDLKYFDISSTIRNKS